MYYDDETLTWSDLLWSSVLQPSQPDNMVGYGCFILTHSDDHRNKMFLHQFPPIRNASRSAMTVQTRPPNMCSIMKCRGKRVSTFHSLISSGWNCISEHTLSSPPSCIPISSHGEDRSCETMPCRALNLHNPYSHVHTWNHAQISPSKDMYH